MYSAENGVESDIASELNDFEKRSWAIKVYANERWGQDTPCPLRLVVNSYYSCAHKCAYCYVWSNKIAPSTRPGFRKALTTDIAKAKEYNVTPYVVEVSASTDPFQPIEETYGESLFAIRELLAHGFKVLIVTKNPCLLLKQKYDDLLKEKNLFIDVTITTLKEGCLGGGVLNNAGPTAADKIHAIKEIIRQGKEVRVRIDPVVPTVNGMFGQSEHDLEELVKVLAKIKVGLIISKTMRLSKGMPKPIVDAYYEYYRQNGSLVGSTYALSKELRRRLLLPIYLECKKNGINFCPCCDTDAFMGEKISTCGVEGETKILSRTIQIESQNCTGD